MKGKYNRKITRAYIPFTRRIKTRKIVLKAVSAKESGADFGEGKTSRQIV